MFSSADLLSKSEDPPLLGTLISMSGKQNRTGKRFYPKRKEASSRFIPYLESSSISILPTCWEILNKSRNVICACRKWNQMKRLYKCSFWTNIQKLGTFTLYYQNISPFKPYFYLLMDPNFFWKSSRHALFIFQDDSCLEKKKHSITNPDTRIPKNASRHRAGSHEEEERDLDSDGHSLAHETRIGLPRAQTDGRHLSSSVEFKESDVVGHFQTIGKKTQNMDDYYSRDSKYLKKRTQSATSSSPLLLYKSGKRESCWRLAFAV